MAKAERFESQATIHPLRDSPQYRESITENQYREVGRKAVDLLRETPTVILRFAVKRETAHHLEPDPTRQPPQVQRMTLDVLRLEKDEEATYDGLLAVVRRQQAKIDGLEEVLRGRETDG